MAESEKSEKMMGKDSKAEEAKEKPKKAKKSEIIKSAGGSTDKINSTMRGEVKYVQPGVTDGKGKKGSYIWYKDPRSGGASEKDRDFVYDENMQEANSRPEMRKYNANKVR